MKKSINKIFSTCNMHLIKFTIQLRLHWVIYKEICWSVLIVIGFNLCFHLPLVSELFEPLSEFLDNFLLTIRMP